MNPTDNHDDATPPARQALPKYRSAREASRIYLLPNLFTAGNMFCGFFSIYSCILAKFASMDVDKTNMYYKHAIYYILGACIFDLFDGRIARAARRESLFGIEFDSIADTVSFGVAPALMVCFLILDPAQGDATLSWVGNIGKNFAWVFAFIYLLCVGIRLARFNVLANPLIPGNEHKPADSDFIGLPCPTAAGMIASLVLLLTEVNLKPDDLKKISTLFLPLILLISYLMVSPIRYPSFKHINWDTRLKVRVFIPVFLLLLLGIRHFEYVIPFVFLAFILNGIFYSLRKKARARRLGATTGETENEDNPEDEF
ncbi:MAG: phosphatidylcholine/phosphatidylserine synthase [Puniceicoccales bacterium]|jgi:CDP-diacylglycerol--serine O-phosphatidyltransferase|nr:phosphatidylcholine/phosphatidylserine synthase [Puniceicoccales bacterium]